MAKDGKPEGEPKKEQMVPMSEIEVTLLKGNKKMKAYKFKFDFLVRLVILNDRTHVPWENCYWDITTKLVPRSQLVPTPPQPPAEPTPQEDEPDKEPEPEKEPDVEEPSDLSREESD